MPDVSIGCLIYRSPRFADAVWNSLHAFTPALRNGGARCFFVANDATPNLVAHLKQREYPFVEQHNPQRTDEWLFKHGFGPPEYIHRVYRGWNRAIQESSEVCVLVSSDMEFSHDWLKNLLKHLTPKRYVVSQLVEPRRTEGDFSIRRDFGQHPDCFRHKNFVRFAGRKARSAVRSGSITRPGGWYGPGVFHRQFAMDVGCYPEGNLAGAKFSASCIREYGDQNLIRKFIEAGGEHITALDSIVYHYREGEMKE